jgi:hypothetical protein
MHYFNLFKVKNEIENNIDVCFLRGAKTNEEEEAFNGHHHH